MRPGGAGPRRHASGSASARRRPLLAEGLHPMLARAAGGPRAAALLRPAHWAPQMHGMPPRLIRCAAQLREAGRRPRACRPARAGGSAAQAGVPGRHLWRPALLWQVAGLRARARALPARHYSPAGARGAAAARNPAAARQLSRAPGRCDIVASGLCFGRDPMLTLLRTCLDAARAQARPCRGLEGAAARRGLT